MDGAPVKPMQERFLNTFIYWCDRCGKRFARDDEGSKESKPQAGSIFCTDCTKPSPRAPNKASVRKRTGQAKTVPARPPSERPLPQRGASTGRHTQPLSQAGPSSKPALFIGVGAAVLLVVVLIFALGGSKTSTATGKKQAGATSQKKAPDVDVKPETKGDTPHPVITAVQKTETAPKTAIDAERQARMAFDELEAKLKEVPESDKDTRLALCEAFLKDHGSTILAARIRTRVAKLRAPAPATGISDAKNLALGKPVKTSTAHEGANVPARAVDGNTAREAAWFGNKWPSWLEVDLQQTRKIASVNTYFYHDGIRYYQYRVESSTDGKEYRVLADMSQNTTPETAQGTRHTFKPVFARYVRIHILKHSRNPSVHLAEVQVEPASDVASATASVLARLSVDDFSGGRLCPNFKGLKVKGRAIWGIRTDKHKLAGALKVNVVPNGKVALRIRSLRHPNPDPAAIRILLNGTVVYDGRDKNTEQEWKASLYELPHDLVKSGENQLEIVCTEDSNIKNRAPWFMVDWVELIVVE